jgi:RND family efflux transporter MFP subunit
VTDIEKPSQSFDEFQPSAESGVGRRRWSGRRRSAALASLCAAGTAGTAFLLWPSDEPRRQEVSAASLTVSIASPKSQVWTDTLVASGTVAAWQEASIGTQIGGYEIREVRVNVGDQVRRGQVLAVLNPALLQAEEAQLIASQEQAEVNRRRAASLKASGGISDQDILQAETTARSAAALLAAKRLQLRYTVVRAPDDGVISARPATVGAVAPVGQELFRLIRDNRLEWRGELTAAQLTGIRAGQTVSLALPDASSIGATVRQVAPMLDDRSRLGIVYADILQGAGVRAGMYATGRIVVGRSPALTVPASSLVIRDGRSYVIRVTGRPSASKVVQQAVTTGRRHDGEVEVTGGLDRHARVVTTGADFLDDGDIVRVAQPSAGSARP